MTVYIIPKDILEYVGVSKPKDKYTLTQLRKLWKQRPDSGIKLPTQTSLLYWADVVVTRGTTVKCRHLPGDRFPRPVSIVTDDKPIRKSLIS